ncbi:hypothetical protein F5148DRAFT_172172 [Russula earlei]|uniref:Uncharacterized protein n=1 Tax=Russula earlei TaxID=71964 RepID=A0ACC0TQI6_9AGAM|nr:hypothetical protein F5148DRAFT_172172 [Russula earlei]
MLIRTFATSLHAALPHLGSTSTSTTHTGEHLCPHSTSTKHPFPLSEAASELVVICCSTLRQGNTYFSFAFLMTTRHVALIWVPSENRRYPGRRVTGVYYYTTSYFNPSECQDN